MVIEKLRYYFRYCYAYYFKWKYGLRNHHSAFFLLTIVDIFSKRRNHRLVAGVVNDEFVRVELAHVTFDVKMRVSVGNVLFIDAKVRGHSDVHYIIPMNGLWHKTYNGWLDQI